MHLNYDLQAAEGQVSIHPQLIMRDLKITYQHSTPQSMGDCWWFWNCENVPDKLPSYLSELKVKPEDAIGYGLSKEMAEEIKNYKYEVDAPNYESDFQRVQKGDKIEWYNKMLKQTRMGIVTKVDDEGIHGFGNDAHNARAFIIYDPDESHEIRIIKKAE